MAEEVLQNIDETMQAQETAPEQEKNIDAQQMQQQQLEQTNEPAQDNTQEPTPTQGDPTKELYDALSSQKYGQLYTDSYDKFLKDYGTDAGVKELYSKLSSSDLQFYTDTEDKFIHDYFPQLRPEKTVTAKKVGDELIPSQNLPQAFVVASSQKNPITLILKKKELNKKLEENPDDKDAENELISITERLKSTHNIDEAAQKSIESEFEDTRPSEKRNRLIDPEGKPFLGATDTELWRLKQKNPDYYQYSLNDEKVASIFARNNDRESSKKYENESTLFNKYKYANNDADNLYYNAQKELESSRNQEKIIETSKSLKSNDSDRQKAITYHQLGHQGYVNDTISTPEKALQYLSTKIKNEEPAKKETPLLIPDEEKKSDIKEYVAKGVKIDDVPLSKVQEFVDEKNPYDVRAFEVYKQDRLNREKQFAIDATTERALKNKGIVAAKGTPAYMSERSKIEQSLNDGNAVVISNPVTGKPDLAQGLGFFGGIVHGLNESIKTNDEAYDFDSMTLDQKVQFAESRMQGSVTPEGYYGQAPSGFFGEAGETIGGTVPVITKMTTGTVAAAGLIAAAPETMGASLYGLAPVLGFAFSVEDATKQGSMNQQLQAYYQLKEKNPNANPSELMKEAEKTATIGQIKGGLTHLALTSVGGKPLQNLATNISNNFISSESKNLVTKIMQKIGSGAVETIESGAKMAALSAPIEAGAAVIQGAVDPNLKKSKQEIYDETVDAAASNFKAGSILHFTTLATLGALKLPATLNSALKQATINEYKANPGEVEQVLSMNEEIGNIPPGATEKVLDNLNSYNQSLQKVPEATQQASQEITTTLAGLIDKKNKLMIEMSKVDESQMGGYQAQINAIDERIKKVNETGKPLDVEFNSVGQPLEGGEKAAEGKKVYRVEYTNPGTGKKEVAFFRNAEEGDTFINYIADPNNPWGNVSRAATGFYADYDGTSRITKTERGNLIELNPSEYKQFTEEPKPTQNDKENISGVPSEIGGGEEPVQAKPVEGGGAQEISGGGVLQENVPSGEGKVEEKPQIFSIDNKEDFYHGSYNKREGKLRTNTAEQFGDAIYFTTSKEEAEGGYPHVTKVKLNIENPIYAGEGKWNEVEKLALEKENANKERDEDGNIIGEVFDLADIKNSKNISDAAKELGYDAIILRGQGNHENETAVLNPSKVIYPEDVAEKQAELPIKLPKEAKEVYHYSNIENLNDLEDREGGTWFTENPSGYQMRGGAKSKISKVIEPSKLNLIKEKDVWKIGDGNWKEGIKKAKESGYDGVYQVVDGDKHYLIFDIKKTKNKGDYAIREEVSGAVQPTPEVPQEQKVETRLQPSTEREPKPEPISKKPSRFEPKPAEPTKPTEPAKPRGKQSGKFEQKANAIAEKIRATELPDWMKVDDKTIKKSGVSADDLKNMLADAVVTMGKLMDKGVEFSQAIKVAVKEIVKSQGEENRANVEAGFEEYYRENIGTEDQKASEEGQPKEVGVSHARINETAKRMGLPEVPRGTVLTPEEYANRGKKLIEGGINPAEIGDNFKKDGLVNADRISIARAHLESLTQDADLAADQYGLDSNEYKNALKKVDDWTRDVVKPMGTESGASMTSLQGSRDMNTGSFTYVKRQVEELTGNKTSKSQDAKIKELTDNNKKLTQKVNDIEKKLIETTNKIFVGEENKPVTKTKKKSESSVRDYKAEREELKSKLRDAIEKYKANMRNLGISSQDKGFEISVEMAKIVMDIAKSHVGEVGAKLTDVAKRTIDDVKEFLDISEKDVHDIISGKYSKKEQKNVSQETKDWKKVQSEAKLNSELNRVLAKEPKTETERKQKNQELEAIRSKINDIKKENKLDQYSEESRIERASKSAQDNINKLEEKLANNDLEIKKAERLNSPELDNLKEKQNELRNELEAKRKEAGVGKYSEESRIEKSEKALEENIKNLNKRLSNNELEVQRAEKLSSPNLERLRAEQKQLIDELNSRKKEKVKLEKEANRLNDLQSRFLNKKDNKFTEDEAKSIWEYAKSEYIDKGVRYMDMISKVADDIGLTWRQVAEAITSPEDVKVISDEMWKKKSDLLKNQNATKIWIEEQNKSAIWKGVKKFTNSFRGSAVFGHGGIFVGTHSGMNLFDPTRLKVVIPAFLNGYKFAYGNNAAYELSMHELRNNPNYIRAQRAGLQNNPDVYNAEEYQKYQTALGRLGMVGQKGFNAIKVLRQQLFDAEYNKLTQAEKDDPKVAESIAQIVNLATGATNLKMPEWFSEATFAGGMESARWGKLTRSPLKATETTLRVIKDKIKGENTVSLSDKVFAKIWAKRVGLQLGTFASMLAVNAAIQNYINPKNKVNISNPNDPDWLKFKFGDITIDPTSGMLQPINFIKGLMEIATENQKDLGNKTRLEKEGAFGLKYLRGKLSPFYGTALEQLTRTDFKGNVLPYFSDEPQKGKHKLTYLEYALSKGPLPVAEAVGEIYNSAAENESNRATTNQVIDGILSGALSGGTGFRFKIGESKHYEKKEKTYTIYQKNGSNKRDATEKELQSADIKAEEMYKKALNQLKQSKTGIYGHDKQGKPKRWGYNKYGELTISKSDIVKYGDYVKLSKEDKDDLHERIKSQKTREARENIKY